MRLVKVPDNLTKGRFDPQFPVRVNHVAHRVPSPPPAAMRFASNVAQGVQRMLSGCTDVDPQLHGMTSDEERAASRMVQVEYDKAMLT